MGEAARARRPRRPMTQRILLQITFLCRDHTALLRACVEQGMLPAAPPTEVAVHGKKVDGPADWIAVNHGERTLGVHWPDGSDVYVSGHDFVRTAMRGYMLDVPELVEKLAAVPFE